MGRETNSTDGAHGNAKHVALTFTNLHPPSLLSRAGLVVNNNNKSIKTMSIDQADYSMTPEEEGELEYRLNGYKHCAVRDTRDAMFLAYKDAGYAWCPVKDAFIYSDGHWIGRRDAMAAWLSY